jgi:peptide/nickel transport system permease protein
VIAPLELDPVAGDPNAAIDRDGAPGRERIRLLLRSGTFWVGAVIVGFWLLCALVGPSVTPHDPLATSADVFAPPSASHWFGTDKNGRDVFSRVIAGAREILLIAPAGTLIGIVLGTAIGLITGFFGGIVDDVVSRLVDAVLALPVIIVAVVALAALGTSAGAVIAVIGIVFTPYVARTMRAAVLAEADLEYVQAVRLRGERASYIMGAEILPNVSALVLVELTTRLGYAIFTVAGLSFIGFGVQPPSPDWGLQIYEHYASVQIAWWTVLWPALAIASLVVGVHLVSDAVASAMEG